VADQYAFCVFISARVLISKMKYSFVGNQADPASSLETLPDGVTCP
jgi:hypothetical protein